MSDIEKLFGLIPERTAVLVIGPPHSEKTLFAQRFLCCGLHQNEPAVYVTANNFPEDLITEFSRISKSNIMDFIQKQSLYFIDCYSEISGSSSKQASYICRISEPSALSEIAIRLSQAIENKQSPRVVIDSVSTLFLHNDPNLLERFLKAEIGKLKSRNARILLLVEDGVHDPHEISLLESLTDATVRFEKDKLYFFGLLGGVKIDKIFSTDGI